MFELVQSSTFTRWLNELRDLRDQARIQARLDRLRQGNPGDVKPVGAGLSELRLHFGPGYRLYYVRRGETIVLLLCGGDKSSQTRDIELAHQILREWRD